MDELNPQNISKIANLLKHSRNVLFITGAGISADSGLPTYRGIGGLYNHEGVVEAGMRIEELISGNTMNSRPDLCWKYLKQIEDSCRGASYNKAHSIIAEMEHYFEKVCVLTQNVDEFHQNAGSTNIIDIHGNLHKLQCVACDYKERTQDYSQVKIPPKCPECGSLVRPMVVLFGEMLSIDKLEKIYSEIQEGFDIIFTIGTTSTFPYIALPVEDARKKNIPTIEINPSDTNVTHLVDIKLRMTAADALKQIWENYLRTN